jgi:hypothetical protein
LTDTSRSLVRSKCLIDTVCTTDTHTGSVQLHLLRLSLRVECRLLHVSLVFKPSNSLHSLLGFSA